MNRQSHIWSALFGLLLAAGIPAAAQDYCKYVDPFIGTDYTGHTYPAATTPHGMVQAGPDNGTQGWEFCSGYHSSSKYIIGFSHTHLSGTGCLDMGDILLMPATGNVNLKNDNGVPSYRSAYSHETEEAAPGYYKVTLETPHVVAEMTASPRAAIHRYSYPANAPQNLVIDLEHGTGDRTIESYLRMVDDHTLVGMRRSSGFINDHHYYFCARFSKPFKVVSSLEDGRTSQENYVSGIATKMLIQFAGTDSAPVLVKIGLSTATEKGAIRNLDKEIAGWDFEDVKTQAHDAWNKQLSKIDVDAMDDGQRISFYTALYHALLMPNIVTDVDGSYCGWDKKLHHSHDGEMYTNYSLWDTYRALHPFLALMYPSENSGFVHSLLERQKQVGLLVTNEYGLCETWCMIGNHAIPVIVDAYLKGDKSFDAGFAYGAIKHALTAEHNKSDWKNYDRYGYFPFDNSDRETVSRTLEATYDNYCAAQMAKALGKEEDCKFFTHRAGFYKNLFDKTTCMMRPRDTHGQWRTPFNPYSLINEQTGKRDYTEGNAIQWTWHVQHDPMGLISLFPSREKFVLQLDSLFMTKMTKMHGSDQILDVTGLIGLYSQGNEPSHHVAYLYTLAGRPDRTAEVVREVFDRFYLPKRDGLCGNDDCGQMSAWYLFSAMGFYPVDPASPSGEYVLGAPQVRRVTLHLPNGKVFTMTADKISAKNKYVKNVSFNGRQIPLTTFSYKDLMKGGTLRFTMSSRPQKASKP